MPCVSEKSGSFLKKNYKFHDNKILWNGVPESFFGKDNNFKRKRITFDLAISLKRKGIDDFFDIFF